jgi:hypothetical protein
MPIDALTADDLRQFPVWEFALDEEGVEGQDETTVRPVIDQRDAHEFQIVRATFETADATQFVGCVTPNVANDPGFWQPTIMTSQGQVHLWLGLRREGISDEELDALHDRLGKSGSQLFPMTYRGAVPWRGVPIAGTVEGFMWMTGANDDTYSVMR